MLLGAEINSAAELQTAKDTATGAPLPEGERQATASDAFPEDLPGTPDHDAAHGRDAPRNDGVPGDDAPRLRDAGESLSGRQARQAAGRGSDVPR